MIAYIRGELLESNEKGCIILTSGGLGYELALPAHSLGRLPEKGEQISFYTSLVVREDAMELFGFETLAERQTFDVLTGISRIGSRTALAILSIFRPDDLRRVVLEADVGALTKVSGIGQKTAQHILLELKYRLGTLDGKTAPVSSTKNEHPVFYDTLAALANLGYGEEECAPLIRKILKSEPDLDTGTAIRQTLKALAKGNG